MHLSDMDDDCPRSSSTLHEANNPEIRMFRVFKVGYLNVNRLLNKLDSVKELIDKYSSDILALSKIWLMKLVIAKFLSWDTQLCEKTDRIRRKLAVVEFLFMLGTVSHLFAKLNLWTITLNVFGSKLTDGSASPWLSASCIDRAM